MNVMYTQKILQPYVRIVEQPARSAVRFRYECEGRSAGPIPGVNSSPSCATYPTIQIMNYVGSRSMVVVSCVTVSQPYKQHPHHLVGRVGCHNGVCTMIVDNSDHLCTFTHLGIQCAKRNEIESRLKLRKQLQIDPTFGGFDHITKTTRGVDLGCVRLCFQVYLEGPEADKYCIPLEPVVSDPVYDKKLLSKLTITDISTNQALVTGGKVMLFCNYIDEDDIEVVFFECDITGMPVWQCLANLKPPFGEVHKRVGMSFQAPAYKDANISQTVKCFMQLRRTSDHEASEPTAFYYLPLYPRHNCPTVEYININRGLNFSGYSKKVKSNNAYKQNSELNPNTDEVMESKPELIEPIVDNLLKYEDIDSDIDCTSSQNNFLEKELVSNEKLVIKSETIHNQFNEDSMVEQNLPWNIPTERKIDNNAQFNEGRDESDQENGHHLIQSLIQ